MMWIIAKSTTIATTPHQIYLCFFLQFWTFNFCKVVAIAIFVVLWELPTTSPLWWDQTSHHTVETILFNCHKKKQFSSNYWNPGLSHFNAFFCIIMLFHWHSHILAYKWKPDLRSLIWPHTHIHVAPCTPRKCRRKSFPEADVEAKKSQFTGIFSDLCLIKTTR